jgi:hypothetical protein
MPGTTSFPIETRRLLIRPVRLDDLDELAEIVADPEVMRHITAQTSARPLQTTCFPALKSIMTSLCLQAYFNPDHEASPPGTGAFASTRQHRHSVLSRCRAGVGYQFLGALPLLAQIPLRVCGHRRTGEIVHEVDQEIATASSLLTCCRFIE